MPVARSGRASLRPIDDAQARQLATLETLVTMGPNGWHAVIVLGVRESAWGDDKDNPQPCAVVDVATAPAGRTLTYAPEDLYRVRLRGAIGT